VPGELQHSCLSAAAGDDFDCDEPIRWRRRRRWGRVIAAAAAGYIYACFYFPDDYGWW
jgi:hypothetical protein